MSFRGNVVTLSIGDVKNLTNFIIIGSSQTEPYKDKKKYLFQNLCGTLSQLRLKLKIRIAVIIETWMIAFCILLQK